MITIDDLSEVLTKKLENSIISFVTTTKHDIRILSAFSTFFPVLLSTTDNEERNQAATLLESITEILEIDMTKNATYQSGLNFLKEFFTEKEFYKTKLVKALTFLLLNEEEYKMLKSCTTSEKSPDASPCDFIFSDLNPEATKHLKNTCQLLIKELPTRCLELNIRQRSAITLLDGELILLFTADPETAVDTRVATFVLHLIHEMAHKLRLLYAVDHDYFNKPTPSIHHEERVYQESGLYTIRKAFGVFLYSNDLDNMDSNLASKILNKEYWLKDQLEELGKILAPNGDKLDQEGVGMLKRGFKKRKKRYGEPQYHTPESKPVYAEMSLKGPITPFKLK